MSCKSERVLLLDQIQVHVSQLNTAIRRLSVTRRQLKEGAMEVKTDIQTTMTQQMEALRERELHLLRQVDLVQQAKDAAIRGQEDELHQVLGSLTNTLETGESALADQHIRDTLERLKKLELQPKETSHLSFKADLPRLSDSISAFGHLDTIGPALDSFFSREFSSASLPQPFEDYEDDDHHVLYRTVGEMDTDTTTRQISVTIPALSKKPEDWLFIPSEQIEPVSPQLSMKFLFPPFLSNNLAEWLVHNDDLNQSASSVASIHQWLCDIQEQGDVEEDDEMFEVLSPTPTVPASCKTSESIEILKMEDFMTSSVASGSAILERTLSGMFQTAVDSKTNSYFQQVMSSPVPGWLMCPSLSAPESRPAYCREILRYFREISDDTKHWLMEYNDKHKTSLDQARPDDGSACKRSPEPVDIENLGELICAENSVSGYFTRINSDPRTWLQQHTEDEDKDTDDCEMQQKLRTVCQANETCSSFQDCLCDKNCSFFLGKKPAANVFGYFAEVDKQGNGGWLLEDVEVEGSICSLGSVATPFSCPVNPDDWLLSGAGESQKSVSSCCSDNSPWLMSQASASPQCCSYPDLKQKWKRIFRHNIPADESVFQTPPSTPSRCSVNSQWLYYDTAPTSQSDESYKKSLGSCLSGEVIRCEKGGWLLAGDPSSQNPCNKEVENSSLNKLAELPEYDGLFACFQGKSSDYNDWLCTKVLID